MKEHLDAELAAARAQQQSAIQQLQEMDRVRPMLVATVQITEGTIQAVTRLLNKLEEPLNGDRSDNLPKDDANEGGAGV